MDECENLAMYIVSASHRSPVYNTEGVPGDQTRALFRSGVIFYAWDFELSDAALNTCFREMQKLFPCVLASIRLQGGEVTWLQSPPEITVCQGPSGAFGHGVSSYHEWSWKSSKRGVRYRLENDIVFIT